MIRVGYFCSAGHTEAGGIHAFLGKIDGRADVEWQRCFPALTKPGPKLTRPAPKPAIAGTTGDNLVAQMLDRMRQFHRPGTTGALDVVLLIDDADCRFAPGAEDFAGWTEAVRKRVEQASGAAVPFVALFASPEIEAWFIADWEKGLGAQYRGLATGQKPLRAHVDELVGALPLESFGDGRADGGCKRKLSAGLEDLLVRLGGRYSKRAQGQDMLRRITPAAVAEDCGTYFRPAYAALVRAIAEVRDRG